MFFVAAITAAIDAAGTEQTFYVSSGRGFTTRPTDTPANTPIAPRLSNAGTIRRELFSGNRAIGAIRPAFGEISISNVDGSYDAWKDYSFAGRAFELYASEVENVAFPSGYTQVLETTMGTPNMGMTEIRLTLKDRLTYLDKPIITSSFLGTGGLEGTSEMAGKPKPRLIGDTRFIPAVLIDETKLLYYCHDTGTSTSGQPTVYDGGILLIRDSNYASTAAMLAAAAPAAGHYACYRDGGTYFRLGSPPEFDLQVNSNGGSKSFVDLAVEAGITDASSGAGSVNNAYIDDANRTYLDVMNEHAKVQNVAFGLTRLDVWQSVAFAEPTGSPAYTFTQFNIVRNSMTRTAPQGNAIPAWKVNVKSDKIYSHGSTLANGAAADVRAWIGRTHWYEYTSENAATKTKHLQADEITFECEQGMTQAQVNNYLDLYGTERDLVTVTAKLSLDLLALELNDVVSVTMPRFGFDAGKLFRIVAIRLDLNTKLVEFSLWG